jgi:tetratricopeptide (TPR) repeat protein
LPHLQRAVLIKPLDPAGHLTLAGVLAVNGRTRDAIAEYETAIPRVSDPKMRAVACETLGRLYSQVGNYSKARASYLQALQIDPQRTTAKEGLAKVEFSDAIRNVAESPSGESYLRLGQVFQQAGRVTEARAAYKQALQRNPKLAEAQKDLDALNASSK